MIAFFQLLEIVAIIIAWWVNPSSPHQKYYRHNTIVVIMQHSVPARKNGGMSPLVFLEGLCYSINMDVESGLGFGALLLIGA